MLQRYKSKYFSLIASATTSCTINEREREEIKEITASQNKYRVWLDVELLGCIIY